MPQPSYTGSFSTRIDDVTTAGMMYVGKGQIGALDASAVWQISRVDTSGSPVTTVVKYAGPAGSGNKGDFDQIWNNRASLTYY